MRKVNKVTNSKQKFKEKIEVESYENKNQLEKSRKEEDEYDRISSGFDTPSYKYDELQDILVCNICSAEFQDEQTAKNHLDTHVEKLSCDYCSKTFRNLYLLGVHSTKHNSEKNIKCPLCSYFTLNKTNFRYHLNNKHLNIFKYNCNICDKGFNHQNRLLEHGYTHTGERPHSCIVCRRGFTSDKHLLRHQLDTHQVGIDGQKTSCILCSRYFYKPEALKRHEERCHGKRKRSKEKVHLCTYCGNAFRKQHMLVEHTRVHTREYPFVCSECGKGFIKKDYLKIHERVHNGEKPYSCEFCGKRFAQHTPFRVHKRIHTGERPYVCTFCSKGFTTNQALKLHRKSCSGTQDKIDR